MTEPLNKIAALLAVQNKLFQDVFAQQREREALLAATLRQFLHLLDEGKYDDLHYAISQLVAFYDGRKYRTN